MRVWAAHVQVRLGVPDLFDGEAGEVPRGVSGPRGARDVPRLPGGAEAQPGPDGVVAVRGLRDRVRVPVLHGGVSHGWMAGPLRMP